MNARRTGAAVALVSFLLVASIAWVDRHRTSPGPLAPAHAAHPELAGPGGCSDCHGGLFGSLDEGCAGCHEAVAADLEEGRGLHGNLPAGTTDPSDARSCALCHVEHTGGAVPLTSDASFARAGIGEPDAYDHAALDFRLAGRHLALGCLDCHENAEVDPLPLGSQRFRGLEQRCDACHDDVHGGRMARACADCHGQEHPFEEVRAFRHAEFRAEGAHQLAECARCHEPGSPHAVEALAGAGPPPPARGCAACHDSPHGRDFLARSAALADVAPAEGCASCHDAAERAFGGHPEAMALALHAASGFPLEPPHAGLDCARCHAAAPAGAPSASVAADAVSFGTRYPGRDPDDCAACHADPHGGAFDDGRYERAGRAGERGCLACHERHAFRPARFDVGAHALTAFPLEGAHAAVPCSACHATAEGAAADAPDGPPVFAEAPRACAACHEDAHDGRLLAAALAASRPSAGPPEPPPADGPACGACHVPTRFDDVAAGGFDHAAHTRFALEGAHAALACAACHPRAAGGDPLRAFGFVHEVFGEPPDACATCHADPHGDVLRTSAPGRATGTACETCHEASSFHAVDRAGFDHGGWTGWPLSGPHATLSCESCHAPAGGGAGGAGQRGFGRALGTDCAACHADPHVGQFVEDGRTDCARCHADDASLVFDHGIDSRFPLDRRHADLDCGACHRPWPLEGGAVAVRYKPLGVRCADCHGPQVRR